jgi:hypothetical protein
MGAVLTRNSFCLAVGAASAQFGATLTEGSRWSVISTTNAWIQIGSNPTVAAHVTPAIYLPANVELTLLAQGTDAKVAIIQDSAGGFASLVQVPA